MGAVAVGTPAVLWRVAAEQALRRLAPITLAGALLGALLGVLVGGVGGRLAMLPVAPLVAALVVVWLVVEALRRISVLRPVVTSSALRWVARGGLAAVFAVAVADLAQDAARLA